MIITGLSGWRKEPDSDFLKSQLDFSFLKSKLVVSASTDMASDLRKFSKYRHDQASSQSCVAQSIVKAAEIKQTQKLYYSALASGTPDADALELALKNHTPLSRLALYFLAREAMSPSETDNDGGTYISLAAEMMKVFGVCREEPNDAIENDRAFWPFDLNNVFTSPPWLVMRDAYLHRITEWYRIRSTGDDRVEDVKLALSLGNPVVFGTTVDDNWMGYYTGVINPVVGDPKGKHATVLVGWDPEENVFIDENSWGRKWGYDGFAKLSPDVIASSDSEDFIVVQAGWEEWNQ